MQFTSHDIECLYAARKLILKDVTRHYTIEEIATHVMLSPTKLKKGFKKVFGVGLFEHLQTEILDKSKEMLADKDQSIKLISKALGFKHTNNFSRAFKKRTGMSPGDWRKTLNALVVFMGQFFRFLIKLSSFTTI